MMARQTRTLHPDQYEVAWIAPRTLEFRAAICMLDHDHEEFEIQPGQKFMYYPGDIAGLNVVIATLGSKHGQLLSSNLAEEIKRLFKNIRINLLVGIAAGIPSPERDIRLGDVLLAVGDSKHPAVISYDRGALRDDRLELQHHGYTTFQTANIVVQALERVQLKWQLGKKSFMGHYALIKDKPTGLGQLGYPKTFSDPGQSYDYLFSATNNAQLTDTPVIRTPRDEKERTQIWSGTIGSGNILMKSAQRRNELQQEHGLIGIEMEAVGVLEHLDAGIIRAVSDYADNQKNNVFQPYAAAMAASYAREVILHFRRNVSAEGTIGIVTNEESTKTSPVQASDFQHSVRETPTSDIPPTGDRPAELSGEDRLLMPTLERHVSTHDRFDNQTFTLNPRRPTMSSRHSSYSAAPPSDGRLHDREVTGDTVFRVRETVRSMAIRARRPALGDHAALMVPRQGLHSVLKTTSLLRHNNSKYFGHITHEGHHHYKRITDEIFSMIRYMLPTDFGKTDVKPLYMTIEHIAFGLIGDADAQPAYTLCDLLRICGRFTQGSTSASARRLSRNEMSAMLYMLHLELDSRFENERPECSPDDPYEMTDSDKLKIRLFTRWVKCQCHKFKFSAKNSRCSTEWNFVNNKYGMTRGESSKPCIVVVKSREKQEHLESGSLKEYKSRISSQADSETASRALEAIRLTWSKE